MIRVVLRRVGGTLLVAWFAATLTFALVVALPDDPGRTLLGPHATAETLAAVRLQYCLDDGFLRQYACWLERLVHGDLGESYRTHRPVTALLADRLWPTVQLALAAVVLALAAGVPLGVWAAARRGRWPDRVATTLSLVALSAPAFVVASVLAYVVAYRWGWFPLAGYGHGVAGRLHHLALPALSLATFSAAYYARLVRAELATALEADHVRTARAKGLRERRVVWKHAFVPTAGPVASAVGVDLGVLLSGAVVVEAIFAWPGLGRELLAAILEVDVPVIVGVVLVAALAIAVVNLLVDLAQAWLDPRLRE